MEIKEIDHMPEFECDIDPVTFSKLSSSDQLLAEAFSKLRQEVRWLAEKTVVAHNLAVQTNDRIYTTVKWLAGTIGLAVIEEVIRHFVIQ